MRAAFLNPHRFAAVIVVLFLSVLSGQIYCLSLPTLDKLEPGPYAVGFRTIERYNYSQTIGSPVDYFGDPVAGKISRPIQICIWYPAISNDDAGLVYGEYVFPYPDDSRLFVFLTTLQDREINRLHYLLGGNRSLVLDLLSAEVGSARGIPVAEGKFPILVYAGSRGSGIIENMGLWEYLASCGYIVAAIHSVGADGSTPSGSVRDLEAVTRDMEFAIAAMSEFPSSDISSLAVAGHGLGAQAAVLTAMRHKRVRAVVAAHPFTLEEAQESPLQKHFSFGPDLLSIPLLWVTKWDSSAAEAEIIKMLKYSDRTVLSCDKADEGWLTHYSLIQTLNPDSENPPLEAVLSVYESFCIGVRDFLEMNLKNESATIADSDSKDLALPDGSGLELAVRYQGDKLPPNRDQFMQILNTKGIAAAAEICSKFGIPSVDNPLLGEQRFNGIGYRYMRQGDITSAVEVFRWCTRAYPGSANAWDSYAEASLNAGDSSLALASWKKSLEVLPDDSTTAENIKNWILENTPNRIAEIEAANK
jgi:tetratricopeptide (TPR) repeat protein